MNILKNLEEKTKSEVEKYKDTIKLSLQDKIEDLFSCFQNAIYNLSKKLEKDLCEVSVQNSIFDIKNSLTIFDEIFEKKREFGLLQKLDSWSIEKEKIGKIDFGYLLAKQSSMESLKTIPEKTDNKKEVEKSNIDENNLLTEKKNDVSNQKKLVYPKTDNPKKDQSQNGGFLSKFTSIFVQNKNDGPIQAHMEEETEAKWDPIKKRYVFKGEEANDDDGKPKSPPKKSELGQKITSEKTLSQTEQNIASLIKPPNLMKRRKEGKKGGSVMSLVEGGSMLKAPSENESIFSKNVKKQEVKFFEKLLSDKELQKMLKFHAFEGFEEIKKEIMKEVNQKRPVVDLKKFVKIEEYQKIEEKLKNVENSYQQFKIDIKKEFFNEYVKMRNECMQNKIDLKTSFNKNEEIMFNLKNEKEEITKKDILKKVIRKSVKIQVDLTCENKENVTKSNEFRENYRKVNQNDKLQTNFTDHLFYQIEMLQKLNNCSNLSQEFKNLFDRMNEFNLSKIDHLREDYLFSIEEKNNQKNEKYDQILKLLSNIHKTQIEFLIQIISRYSDREKVSNYKLGSEVDKNNFLSKLVFNFSEIIKNNNLKCYSFLEEIMTTIQEKLQKSEKMPNLALKKISLKLMNEKIESLEQKIE